MQQVLSVLYSMDSKYVLSGSDEMNIRLWKAHASEKLGPVSSVLNQGRHLHPPPSRAAEVKMKKIKEN
jgi:hypothetical protein